MKYFTVGIVCVYLLSLGACATQPNLAAHDAPGFTTGFWHGFIALFSVFGSLFMHIRVYQYPNDGFGYESGFVMGFLFFLLVLFFSAIPRIGGYLVSRN